jgi:uncharacterized lipoprotein YmbA
MMPSRLFGIKSAFLFILVAFATACASTEPAKFYALSAMDTSISENAPDSFAGDITIGIGPIKIPDYLDRPEIVIRGRNNEIIMAEFDQWAGQLKESFALILSENLSIMLSTDNIATHPWSGSIPIDYQVVVEIVQFEGTPGERVTLIARWNVLGCKKNELLAMKRSSFTVTAGSDGYGALVTALSKAIEEYSVEISSTLMDLSQTMNNR